MTIDLKTSLTQSFSKAELMIGLMYWIIYSGLCVQGSGMSDCWLLEFNIHLLIPITLFVELLMMAQCVAVRFLSFD